jgi:hypothetical protein
VSKNLKKTGAYFVEPSQNFGWWGEEVTFISGQNIPTKLVTHIVWFLSKVDPNVVVCNRYDHEEGSFVGVEYQIVRNNKIRFFDDVSEIHLKVLCDDEIEPFLDEHGSESDAITWEQVWEMQLVNGKNALNSLLSDFPECRSYVE